MRRRLIGASRRTPGAIGRGFVVAARSRLSPARSRLATLGPVSFLRSVTTAERLESWRGVTLSRPRAHHATRRLRRPVRTRGSRRHCHRCGWPYLSISNPRRSNGGHRRLRTGTRPRNIHRPAGLNVRNVSSLCGSRSPAAGRSNHRNSGANATCCRRTIGNSLGSARRGLRARWNLTRLACSYRRTRLRPRTRDTWQHRAPFRSNVGPINRPTPHKVEVSGPARAHGPAIPKIVLTHNDCAARVRAGEPGPSLLG